MDAVAERRTAFVLIGITSMVPNTLFHSMAHARQRQPHHRQKFMGEPAACTKATGPPRELHRPIGRRRRKRGAARSRSPTRRPQAIRRSTRRENPTAGPGIERSFFSSRGRRSPDGAGTVTEARLLLRLRAMADTRPPNAERKVARARDSAETRASSENGSQLRPHFLVSSCSPAPPVPVRYLPVTRPVRAPLRTNASESRNELP